jgi:hypothetical protein
MPSMEGCKFKAGEPRMRWTISQGVNEATPSSALHGDCNMGMTTCENHKNATVDKLCCHVCFQETLIEHARYKAALEDIAAGRCLLGCRAQIQEKCSCPEKRADNALNPKS